MTSDDRLHVAFLWHMHQPYYKDPLTGEYRLPWVRLHATKDYLDMVSILRGFPSIRQTFNLVPSLLEQIRDYEAGARDVFLSVSEKPASELTEQDKVFLLENFFFANWQTMIMPITRYYELLQKRGMRKTSAEIADAVRYFSEADYRDLQVLFNLVWIDPYIRQTDPVITEIEKKGKNYSEEDKAEVLKKHAEIISRIIPEYKELWDSGQIEVSTSPYYHPIMPLLIDCECAKEALPDIKLPKRRFRAPEDARRQVKEALLYLESIFGKRPSGMWPPEGSVSEETLKMLAEEWIKWAATDEDVLGASLGISIRNSSGHVSDPAVLYRAYSYAGVHLLFRDRGLSDLIGFVYPNWNPRDAAVNMIENLLLIRKSLPKKEGFVVPIILDGENAWEYYKNDGRDFLLYLYEGLSKEEALKAVTMSEHLAEAPQAEELRRVHSGSWIYANFSTWIGHEEDNLSWDYLYDTRQRLIEYERQNPEADLTGAWKSLYIAEGSDWNWWYGDEHTTELQKEFDELYRANLISVWKRLGIEPPQQLYVPILLEDRAVAPSAVIRGFITPKIDGIVTSFFEWYQAASLSVAKTGGSMHKAESLISDIYWGFDALNFYIRLDPKRPFRDFPDGTSINILFLRPVEYMAVVAVPAEPAEVTAIIYEKSGDKWMRVAETLNGAFNDIFEIGIPFATIRAQENDELNICISISRGGREIERCPFRGYLSVTVPTSDYEQRMWY